MYQQHIGFATELLFTSKKKLLHLIVLNDNFEQNVPGVAEFALIHFMI